MNTKKGAKNMEYTPTAVETHRYAEILKIGQPDNEEDE